MASAATVTDPLVPVAVHDLKTAVTVYVYVPSGTFGSLHDVFVVSDEELVPQAALVTFVLVFVRVA